jgi:hypothetical protein
MKESDIYRPIELPDELSSLDQEIICALRNAVLKYGVSLDGGIHHVLQAKTPGVAVVVRGNLADRGMTIVTDNFLEMRSNEQPFEIPLIHTPGFRSAKLIWDRNVTIEQVVDVTGRAEEIHKEMEAAFAAERRKAN